MAEIEGENMDEETSSPSGSAESGASSPATPVRTKIIVVVGVVIVLLLIIVGVAVSRSNSSSSSGANATPTTADRVCGGGDWPRSAKGTPAAMSNATTASVYLWTDSAGFHIRAIDPNGSSTFSGKVTASAGVLEKSVKTHPADAAVKTDISGNTLNFTIDAGNAATGVDFSMCGSTQASFTVTSGGVLVPVENFYVGAKGRAVFNPLILARN